METENMPGHLVLVMAPSGSGKGTLIESLGELREQMYFAKTFTSREPRQGAAENPKYNFISREEFERMIESGEFVEWANFSGNYYGTQKQEVIEALSAGKIVFKEMELQGVEQMRKIVPKENMTVIYIDAGDWEDLKARILARAPITEEALRLREERFRIESAAKDEAGVIIKNYDGELPAAQTEFRSLISDIINSVTT